MSEGIGPLNLSEADLTGFDPMPSAQYKFEVFEVKPVSIAEDTQGKLPPGTPGYSVQLKIIGDVEGNDGEEYEYYNRRQFDRFYFPPDSYDKTKANVMKGRFVKFCLAIGYEESDVMGGSFSFDEDDATDREGIVTLGQQPAKGDYPAGNKVLGYKSLAEVTASSSGLI